MDTNDIIANTVSMVGKLSEDFHTSPSDVQMSESVVRIDDLRRDKARGKSDFTRTRHRLLMLLDDEDFPSRREVRVIRERLMTIEKCVLTTMIDLQCEFIKVKNTSGKNSIYEEMDTLEHEMSSTQNRAQEYLDARADDPSSLSSVCSRTKKWINRYGVLKDKSKCRSEIVTLVESADEVFTDNSASDHTVDTQTDQSNQDSDMTAQSSRLNAVRSQHDREVFSHKDNSWNNNIGDNSSGSNEDVTTGSHNRSNIHSDTIGQDFWRLKRVTIPVFSGDKSKYYSWRAAFLGCIDKAPASAEFKLLQLREYLKGEALEAIEQLGHSATAYEAAKQRQEELESFHPVRSGHVKELEKFADVLDVAVVNLKEANRQEELGDGSLYMMLQRKLPETMLSQYHRWTYENKRTGNVELLREWINQEAEYQIVAAETVRGIHVEHNICAHSSERTHLTQHNDDVTNTMECKMCSGNHDIWNCESFKQLTTSQRWQNAFDNRLCFCCLGVGHFGNKCLHKIVCGLDHCKETHHRLLHRDKINNLTQGSNPVQPAAQQNGGY